MVPVIGAFRTAAFVVVSGGVVLLGASVASGVSTVGDSVRATGANATNSQATGEMIATRTTALEGHEVASHGASVVTPVTLPAGSIEGGKVRRLGPVPEWLADRLEQERIDRERRAAEAKANDVEARRATTNNRTRGG